MFKSALHVLSEEVPVVSALEAGHAEDVLRVGTIDEELHRNGGEKTSVRFGQV